MTERIQGPSGPPDSTRPGARGSRKVDSGKFQEEMRRIDEVSQVDPDEAKKRKRPEEALREEEAAKASGEEEKKTPLAKSGEFKISASETQLPEGAKTAAPGAAAAEQNMEPSALEEQIPLKRDTEEEKPSLPLQHEEGIKTFLSEAKQHSSASEMFKTRAAEIEEGVTMPAAPETSEEEKKAQVAAVDSSKISSEETGEKGPQTPQVEELTKEEEISLPEDPPPAYTHLHPDVLDIFERTVGAMIYMDAGGVRETTIIINKTEEKPSVFNGARITIREYSTAPKEFNVELAGSPKAVDLFQSNMPDLKTAFDSVPAKFKVKNIQTSYQ